MNPPGAGMISGVRGQALLETAFALLILSAAAGAGATLVQNLWKRTRCDHLQFRHAIHRATASHFPRTPGPSPECTSTEPDFVLRTLDEISIEEFR